MLQQLDRPLASIVIPSYNHAKYIGKTIDSIIGQTIFSQLELIVIDDGSKDDSVSVIERHLQGHSNTTLISRANRGMCRTLNQGLSLSRGKYFSYIGSDDLMAPDKMEVQIKAIEARNGNVAACYSDCFIIDGNDQTICKYGDMYNYRSGDIYLDLLWMRFQPCSATNMFSREAITSIGGFDEDLFIEDKDTWVKIARIYSVEYVPKPLAYYRSHGENTSLTKPDKMNDYLVEVVRNSTKKDPALAPQLYFMEAKLLVLLAGANYYLLRMDEARKCALAAIVRNPFNKAVWRTLIMSLLGARIVGYIRDRRKVSLQQSFKVAPST